MLAARFKLIVWDNFLQLQILQNVKKKKWYNTYTCTLTVKLSTENQLEFAITSTLFCDLSEIKCFAATNFHNQDVDYLKTDLFTRYWWWLVCGGKYLR